MKYKVGQFVIMHEFKSSSSKFIFFKENKLCEINSVSHGYYHFKNTACIASDMHIKGLAFKQYLEML